MPGPAVVHRADASHDH